MIYLPVFNKMVRQFWEIDFLVPTRCLPHAFSPSLSIIGPDKQNTNIAVRSPFTFQGAISRFYHLIFLISVSMTVLDHNPLRHNLECHYFERWNLRRSESVKVKILKITIPEGHNHENIIQEKILKNFYLLIILKWFE